MNIAPLGREATLEDLWDYEGPAELIDGEIVPMTGTQFGPGNAAFTIRLSLHLHAQANGGGFAISESVTFVMETPRTQAFHPDAAWFVGRVQDNEIVRGAPALAVEIRSNGDYGPTAERKMSLKRGHYFAAGTRVVWDVDVLRERCTRLPRGRSRAPSRLCPRRDRRCRACRARVALPGGRSVPVTERGRQMDATSLRYSS